MFFLRLSAALLLCLQLAACNTIDLYEKTVPIPQHQWRSAFRPAFTFTIKDTAASYRLYLIIRHNNQYRYNNVWVNLYAKGPAGPAQKFSLELPLANKEGWLGSGMDDVFEQRAAFALDPQKFGFTRSGNYTFTLEHVMREDPLANVMNAGIRIEKKAL